MTKLCELAVLYGSDKTPTILHGYTEFYDELLKNRTITNVLEIGIGTPTAMFHLASYTTGASLRMWRDYFPNAEIMGLDNDPTAMMQESRIRTMLCDQGSEESLKNVVTACVGTKFDLIVDDGSHRYQDQARTANILLPELLSSKGVYIIEDVVLRNRQALRSSLNLSMAERQFNPDIFDDCIFFYDKQGV